MSYTTCRFGTPPKSVMSSCRLIPSRHVGYMSWVSFGHKEFSLSYRRNVATCRDISHEMSRYVATCRDMSPRDSGDRPFTNGTRCRATCRRRPKWVRHHDETTCRHDMSPTNDTKQQATTESIAVHNKMSYF